MAKRDKPPTQKTQPKKGEPVEIPIPTRAAFLRNLRKVAPPTNAGGNPQPAPAKRDIEDA